MQYNASGIFATAADKQVANAKLKDLHARIGQQPLEAASLAGVLGSHRRCERSAMIDSTNDLPIVRQVKRLDVSRSSVIACSSQRKRVICG